MRWKTGMTPKNASASQKNEKLALTFILVKSITWNIGGAINNLGSKASTTGCMGGKWRRNIRNFNNTKCQILDNNK